MSRETDRSGGSAIGDLRDSPGPLVSFHHWSEFPWRADARDHFLGIIEQHHPVTVLEVGAGTNPTLSADDVNRMGLRYVVNDESADQLRDVPGGFDVLTGSITDETVGEPNSFDLIFSRMVNEHVADGRSYYHKIASLLRPGGVSAHLFSTLWAFPFAANFVLPPTMSDRLLDRIHPWNDGDSLEKFRAHYSWSRGPTRRSIENLHSVGLEVVSYQGYFGHGYYATRFPWLDRIEQAKATWLARHPVPMCTAYASLLVRKPVEGSQHR